MPYYFGYYPSSFDNREEIPAEDETPAVGPEPNNTLVSQMEDLSDEVEILREQQSSRGQSRPNSVAPQPAPTMIEKPLPTVFAYRDGRRFETQNYAILGKTLWIFGDQTTRKVPITDVDLATTKRLNDDRGVEFASPDSP